MHFTEDPSLCCFVRLAVTSSLASSTTPGFKFRIGKIVLSALISNLDAASLSLMLSLVDYNDNHNVVVLPAKECSAWFGKLFTKLKGTL